MVDGPTDWPRGIFQGKGRPSIVGGIHRFIEDRLDWEVGIGVGRGRQQGQWRRFQGASKISRRDDNVCLSARLDLVTAIVGRGAIILGAEAVTRTNVPIAKAAEVSMPVWPSI